MLNSSVIIHDNSIHYEQDISGVISVNMYPVNGPLIGFFYAMTAYGAYYIKQTFPKFIYSGINPSPDTFLIKKYDVTDALQIIIDVNYFNKKLGGFILKRNRFTNSSITFTAKEFVSILSAKNIISLGAFSNLYEDFIHYVNNYFSYSGDFASLFSLNNESSYKNGQFDANSFIELISYRSTNNLSHVVPQIEGSITLNMLNDMLKYINRKNIFGNRPKDLVEKGFIDGDLILVPDGITITLNLNIDVESAIPRNEINNIRKAHINNEKLKTDCNKTIENKTTNIPSQLLSNIQRSYTAPILIKLQ